MTDVSNLDNLAAAIATSSSKIRNYAIAQAAATQSQELDIQTALSQPGPAGTAGEPGPQGATGPTGPAGSGSLAGWYNVKDYGAAGDGTTDDTASIQAAIYASCSAVAAGGILLLPAGRYVISSTLVWPDSSGGGVVMGSGAFFDNPYPGGLPRPGPQTLIFWNGPAGGTMLEQQGCIGWRFQDLTLVGNNPTNSGSDAGIGYLCRYMAGSGAGVVVFQMVGFYDLAVACQMGQARLDDNCSDVAFDHCVWQNCGTCLLIKNIQGVNYRFESPSLVWCKRFIHGASGGSILVNMLNTAACGGTGATDWVFLLEELEPNRSTVIINGWRCEQDTKQLMKAQYLGRITINGFEECQGDQNSLMFYIRGPRLTMRDSRLRSNDSANPFFYATRGDGGQGAALFLDNVYFDVAAWVRGDWLFRETSEVIVQVHNSCYGTSLGNIELPNLNTHSEYGAVAWQ